MKPRLERLGQRPRGTVEVAIQPALPLLACARAEPGLLSDTMSDSDEEAMRVAAALAFEATSEKERLAVAESLRAELQGPGKTVGTMPYVAQPAPGWDVPGLWHCFGTAFRSGYAMAAVSLHWVIANGLGMRIQLTPHRTADIDIDRFPEDRGDMLLQWTKEVVGIPRALISTYPLETSIEMLGVAPKLVPYVAFEGTKISEYGKRLCARNAFERVWVMSDFIRDAFVASGVAPELVRTVSPMLCGGPWPMPALEQIQAARNRPVTHEDPYVFAAVGTWTKRKGMHDLVRAYWSTFKRAEPVVLTIRTSAFGSSKTVRELRESILGELKPIAVEFGDSTFPAASMLARVHFELGTKLSDVELIEWIGSSMDCYVNPSYGEGVGIPQTWAKALGIPLVSTGFGSVGELLRDIQAHAASSALGASAGFADQSVGYRLARVDPVMLRLGLMFGRDTEWGVYAPEEFGAGMRRAMNRGRVTDMRGAEYVRKRFGVAAASATVGAALTDVLGETVMQELCGAALREQSTP